jgi:hypothetical protein
MDGGDDVVTIGDDVGSVEELSVVDIHDFIHTETVTHTSNKRINTSTPTY